MDVNDARFLAGDGSHPVRLRRLVRLARRVWSTEHVAATLDGMNSVRLQGMSASV